MHAISVTMETTASSGTEFVSVPLLLVKDEPHDDPEMADSNFVLNDASATNEPDPMNLLDPMREMQALNASETVSDQLSTTAFTPEVWQSWMAEYPWLLHEDADEHYGYCLYCNSKLNFKAYRNPANHAQKRTHRENEENYLAFKQSQENANLSTTDNGVTIKQEFGTDNDISAMKFKRMSQTEPLFNFNWRRWKLQHPWLERDKNDITYGYCKYCKMRIQVEYSYMRQRHELSVKHKLAAYEYGKRSNEGENDENASSIGKRSELDRQAEESESGNGNEDDTTEQSNKESDGQDDEENAGGEVQRENTLKRKRNPRGHLFKNPWIELHNNYPRTCRCKLCNVTMIAANFNRHLNTQLHLEGERKYKAKNKSLANSVKQERPIKSRNWKIYAKRHPWLIPDPDDPHFAYCKFCKKRMLYAIHPVKRLIHERGAGHKNAEKLYKAKLAEARVKSGVNGESADDTEEDVNVGEENNDEAGSDENAEGNEGGATEDDDEENEEENEGDNDANQATKSKISRIPKNTDEWYAMFPWCERYENDPKHMWCSYCQTKLKITFRRKQHEKTSRHKEAAKNINASRKLTHLEKKSSHNRSTDTVMQKPTTSNSNPTVKPVIPLAQRSVKYKVTMWRNRFPWLTYKRTETQPNYGYCKYCEMRVYVATEKFAMKHQRSLKHVRLRIQLRRQNVQNQAAEVEKQIDIDNMTEKARNELSKKYSWIVFDKKKSCYGVCKYCKIRLNISGVLKDRHEMTIKHARAKLDYFAKTPKEGEKTDQAEEQDQSASAVVVVEDDVVNEEASVKSEPMDEDDVLNYLLQRSVSDPKRTMNEPTDQAVKRQKTPGQHENLIERAKRLTSAHLEILRLSRDLNDSKTSKKNDHISLPSSIFNTSAAIAALLSPQQAPAPPPNATPPTRNNFELFFDSVCESVKTLPSDLAAEGKIKIAQLVADLELRALQRSQSKDQTVCSPSQAVGNQMSSTTASSPALSGADIPSTTTNGLEKDETSPTIPADSAQPPQASSSFCMDSNVRVAPMSSTPINRHSDGNAGSSFHRMQATTSQSDTSFKVVQMNPPTQQSVRKPQNEVNIGRVQTYHNDTAKATTSNASYMQTQNRNIKPYSSPSQANYQPARQTYPQQYSVPSASPESVTTHRYATQTVKQVMQNTTVVDNGFRRIHLGARINQSPSMSTPKEMGFRRIHIPMKGSTTITKTSPKLPTPTYYVNHSNNA